MPDSVYNVQQEMLLVIEPVLCARHWQVLLYLSLTTTPRFYYYPHFTDAITVGL